MKKGKDVKYSTLSKGDKMECPYLETGFDARFDEVVVCGASITLTAPDADERRTYCDTEEHYRCPMLLSRVLRNRRRIGNGRVAA